MLHIEQPLVSVAVITYNSVSTVVETLDSVYNQTYPELELIVSDDCSTDGTVEVCKIWMDEHRDRFKQVRLIQSKENTGISSNLNRAETACKGQWVKSIAGDDILLSNCILDFVNYVNKHPDAMIVFGNISVFDGNDDLCRYLTKCFSERTLQMSKMSQEELYECVLSGTTPPAPSCFLSSKLFLRFGALNDERIAMIEDWPKWLFLLKNGIRFHFLYKEVVSYRLGGISNSERWDTLDLYKDKRRVLFYYVWDYYYVKDKDFIIQKTIDEEGFVYEQLMKTRKEVTLLRTSFSYKVGTLITLPIRKIRKMVIKCRLLWRKFLL